MDQLVVLRSSDSWSGELLAMRKDGSTFDVHVSATTVKDSNGEPVCFMSSFLDITARKQAEQKLQNLYEQERELRQQIEREMNKRIEFTRALAHELKTPLTPVVMSSQILTNELQDETLLRVAKNINRGATNLNSRINELLDLAKGEIGMLRIRAEKVDLLQLLREVVEEVTPVTSSRRQSLLVKLPPSLPPMLPPVQADRGRLKQIVLNLLNNSLKFTPEGGKITLGARKDGDYIIVEVNDTGPGIPDSEQERLFEPYYRLDSDREKLSGLGLGLALSKSLVELHGGQIWVKSKMGRGSTFGFSLPIGD